MPTHNAEPALCESCGLCCDGTLFRDLRIERDEVATRDAMRDLGIVATRSSGAANIPQPCACLDGHLCRIYTKRPRACREYTCAVLRSREGGSMSITEARRRITTAQRLKAEAPASPLALAALDVYLTRWFRCDPPLPPQV